MVNNKINKEEFGRKEMDELIRGKNINFLIGAGASAGLYRTLKLFKNKTTTLEDILSREGLSEKVKKLIYAYYFREWIKPMSEIFDISKGYKKNKVIKNYKSFIDILYTFLQQESNESPKRINIFTTNYDLLFEKTFDDFLTKNQLVYFNDGSRGFFKKYISITNFHLNVTHSGVSDNYKKEIPTINLFKLHGSISWELEENGKETRILVNNDFGEKIMKDIENGSSELLKFIDTSVKGEYKNEDEFKESFNTIANQIEDEKLEVFIDSYSELSIINPDKRKFSQTVLEQHYYQLIRTFSYELERKQSILIVFGFSFADEHIRDIFKRSLLNPELQVIMISFKQEEQDKMKNEYFEGFANIKFLPDFSNNNEEDNEKGNFQYLLSLLGLLRGDDNG